MMLCYSDCDGRKRDVMGEIVKVQCGVCRAKWECMEGCGLLYGKKETVIAAFSERERAEVSARIEKSRIPAYDFAYQIAVCSHCKNVVSVPVLVTDEDGAYVGVCPVCGKGVESPGPDLESKVCPVCKSSALKAEIDGHWD